MPWKSLCKTLILALLLASAQLEAADCISTESLLEFGVAKKPDNDLFRKYDQEVEAIKRSLPADTSPAERKKLISKQIEQLNQTDLQSFQIKNSSFSVLGGFGKKMGEDILRVLASHPVVGDQALSKYGENASEIGFCFGRATIVH